MAEFKFVYKVVTTGSLQENGAKFLSDIDDLYIFAIITMFPSRIITWSNLEQPGTISF